MRKTLFAVVALLLFSNCGIVGFDDDINVSPNAPNQASAPQLIANAMLSLPALHNSTVGLQGQFMAQYLAETQYVNVSLYPEGGTSFYGWYQGPLISLETVLNTSEVDNHLAIARILKAFYMWNLTDRWGDMPYTEALQGAQNFTPAYDTQASIYDALINELKAAHDQINDARPISSDIIYNGDHGKWRRFANTVRMLMALRLSEVDPGKAQSEFVSALNAGIMQSNGDSFVFRHLADANNQNYFYGQIEVASREWWALTESLVALMDPVDDPRLPVYGDPARTTGDYVGLPYGQELPNNTEAFSLLGAAIRAQNAPVYLITYAQALFAKAEAAERNWIGESAQTNYEMAIQESIRQWTGSTAGADAFIAQPGIAFNASTALEQIATQRYVHLFMSGYEGWSEWRRTGYPSNLVTPPSGRAVPNRLSYPDNEAFNNVANYNEAVQRQFGGDDSLYGQIWWDRN
jgi:hypothetical protein